MYELSEAGRSMGVRDEASGRKMVDFMMDGVCFGAFDPVFGTVRHVFGRFYDGRSK